MMLAWFSSSEMTASSAPSRVSKSPPFASKQERVQDRVFGTEEVRDAAFQLFVDLGGAADEAYGCHAEAPAIQRLLGRGDHGRVIGQAEVVVGAEVEQPSGLPPRCGPTVAY